MINRIIIIRFLVILFIGCSSGVNNKFKEEIQTANHKLDFPLPKWNKELEELHKEYKEKFKAKGVKFTRPYFYASEEDSSFWLKVFFLNPDLKGKTIKEFGEEVALYTLEHLTNSDEFEKIEVSVSQKSGFIVTFTRAENVFFYVDSLSLARKLLPCQSK